MEPRTNRPQKGHKTQGEAEQTVKPASILSTAAAFVFNSSFLVAKVYGPTLNNSVMDARVPRCSLAYH